MSQNWSTMSVLPRLRLLGRQTHYFYVNGAFTKNKSSDKLGTSHSIGGFIRMALMALHIYQNWCGMRELNSPLNIGNVVLYRLTNPAKGLPEGSPNLFHHRWIGNWSGIRESNPHFNIGNVVGYHYTNPAIGVTLVISSIYF